MLIWLLMFFDAVTLISLSLVQFHIANPTIILYYCSAYLGIKLLIFPDIMSIIDFVVGVYILLVAIFGFSSFFYYIALGWFIYKFIFTLLA